MTDDPKGQVGSLAPHLLPRTQYEVQELLYERYFAEIYLVTGKKSGRRFAFSVLREGFTNYPEAAKAFIRTAKLASQIGSLHVVKVVDTLELRDGRPVLVTEFIKGRRLVRELSGKPLRPARAIAILRQLARGLTDLHAVGVFHGALTAESVVLVKEDGRKDGVKVADFGIAPLLAADPPTRSESWAAPLPLTPEHVRKDTDSVAKDVYLLGCLGYHMLSGTPPFLARSIEALQLKHVSETPEPLDSIDPAIRKVIDRCLSKDPEDRYEDMSEFEAALIEAQAHAKLRTEWDDLPLPYVEEARLRLLESKLKALGANPRPPETSTTTGVALDVDEQAKTTAHDVVPVTEPGGLSRPAVIGIALGTIAFLVTIMLLLR